VKKFFSSIIFVLFISQSAFAQQVHYESNIEEEKTVKTEVVSSSHNLLLRIKAGIEGTASTSSKNLTSIWTLVGGVEIPVIWRETMIYAELGFGFWRPNSGLDHRTTPLAGSGGFYGVYYPVEWVGLRAGVKGYLFQGRYYQDSMIAQLNVEGDILFNFQNGLEFLIGVSGSVMGTGYRNAYYKQILAPSWYPHLSLRISWDLWDTPPP